MHNVRVSSFKICLATTCSQTTNTPKTRIGTQVGNLYPNWLERWVGEDYLYNVDCVVIADRDNPVELIEKAVQLPYLRLVKLPNCTITDENLRLLQNLKRLEWLELYRTPTTDTGVAIVAKIPSLKILDLRGTNVTDGCLADIESMKGLRSLYVGNTAITSQGIAQIAKALPECSIDSTMQLIECHTGHDRVAGPGVDREVKWADFMRQLSGSWYAVR